MEAINASFFMEVHVYDLILFCKRIIFVLIDVKKVGNKKHGI